MKPLIETLVPHVYRAGESYEYFFEVTEASYSTEQLERLPMIKDLLKIEDLTIRYRRRCEMALESPARGAL